MDKDLEELLATTTKNFKKAEQLYFKEDDNADAATKKLQKANYDNALGILNLVKQMAGLTEPAGQAVSETQVAAPATASYDQPVEREEQSVQTTEPQLSFPSYEEIAAAKHDRGAVSKVPTNDILSEAAKPNLVSGKSRQRQDKTAPHSATQMTREQYRKLHGKK